LSQKISTWNAEIRHCVLLVVRPSMCHWQWSSLATTSALKIKTQETVEINPMTKKMHCLQITVTRVMFQFLKLVVQITSVLGFTRVHFTFWKMILPLPATHAKYWKNNWEARWPSRGKGIFGAVAGRMWKIGKFTDHLTTMVYQISSLIDQSWNITKFPCIFHYHIK
jgi:hypothetical protein